MDLPAERSFSRWPSWRTAPAWRHGSSATRTLKEHLSEKPEVTPDKRVTLVTLVTPALLHAAFHLCSAVFKHTNSQERKLRGLEPWHTMVILSQNNQQISPPSVHRCHLGDAVTGPIGRDGHGLCWGQSACHQRSPGAPCADEGVALAAGEAQESLGLNGGGSTL